MSEKVKVKVNDKRTLGREDGSGERDQEVPVEEALDEELSEGGTGEPQPEGEPARERGPAEERDPEQIIAEQKDRILRLHAEFENYRKRSERETASFRRYANEGLVKAVLPHLDNLDRALEHCREDNPDDPLLTGVEMTLKGLTDALAQFGVSRIEALGEPFDPSLHEAVMRQEDASMEENTVLAETQAGYLLHDRLLRPAMVVVSARPEDAKAGE